MIKVTTNEELLETVADIAYNAGLVHFYSGDSRQDVQLYVQWAREFEAKNIDTDWEADPFRDYIIAIDQFTKYKIAEFIEDHK
jgi:hypothetical protein